MKYLCCAAGAVALSENWAIVVLSERLASRGEHTIEPSESLESFLNSTLRMVDKGKAVDSVNFNLHKCFLIIQVKWQRHCK